MKWIDVKNGEPKENGRYFILTTFDYDCKSNGETVRENVPFVSNYSVVNGCLSRAEGQHVTHWMEIPEPPKKKMNKDERDFQQEQWTNETINDFHEKGIDPIEGIEWIGTLFVHALYCAEVSEKQADEFLSQMSEGYKKINSNLHERYSIEEITE